MQEARLFWVRLLLAPQATCSSRAVYNEVYHVRAITHVASPRLALRRACYYCTYHYLPLPKKVSVRLKIDRRLNGTGNAQINNKLTRRTLSEPFFASLVASNLNLRCLK